MRKRGEAFHFFHSKLLKNMQLVSPTQFISDLPPVPVILIIPLASASHFLANVQSYPPQIREMLFSRILVKGGLGLVLLTHRPDFRELPVLL